MNNHEPFEEPGCSCDKQANVVVVAEDCSVHGIGTAYWDSMTAEIERLRQEMRS